MISDTFMAETDKLIQKFQERKLFSENGNVIVAKVKPEERTKGGIFISSGEREVNKYHMGLARIILLPVGFGESPKDPKVSVGDFIFHTHEARYKLHTDSMRALLDYLVDDDLLYAVQDNEIILKRAERL